jgi:hypothetical protein
MKGRKRKNAKWGANNCIYRSDKRLLFDGAYTKTALVFTRAIARIFWNAQFAWHPLNVRTFT